MGCRHCHWRLVESIRDTLQPDGLITFICPPPPPYYAAFDVLIRPACSAPWAILLHSVLAQKPLLLMPPLILASSMARQAASFLARSLIAPHMWPS